MSPSTDRDVQDSCRFAGPRGRDRGRDREHTFGTVTDRSGRPVHYSPPTVTALSVTTGPASGGTKITVTGTGLAGATSVTFGGVAGTDVTANKTGTKPTVDAPAQNAGTVAVIVTTPEGSSPAVPPTSSPTRRRH